MDEEIGPRQVRGIPDEIELRFGQGTMLRRQRLGRVLRRPARAEGKDVRIQVGEFRRQLVRHGQNNLSPLPKRLPESTDVEGVMPATRPVEENNLHGGQKVDKPEVFATARSGRATRIWLKPDPVRAAPLVDVSPTPMQLSRATIEPPGAAAR